MATRNYMSRDPRISFKVKNQMNENKKVMFRINEKPAKATVAAPNPTNVFTLDKYKRSLNLRNNYAKNKSTIELNSIHGAINNYDRALKKYIPYKLKANHMNKQVENSENDTTSQNTNVRVLRRRSVQASTQKDTKKAAQNKCDEAMDWEFVVNEINQVRTAGISKEVTPDLFKDNKWLHNRASSLNTYIVIDTNIFLSHLYTIETLINNESKGDFQPVVVVSWRVFCELDNLKKIDKFSFSARKALNMLYDNLPKNDKLVGQPLKDANNQLYSCTSPDDEILNCCLQLLNNGNDTVLLSNDKNLINKAIVNSVKAFTHGNFLKEMLNHDKSRNTSLTENSNPIKTKNELTQELSDTYEKIRDILKEFLSPILKGEMITHYRELWLKIVLIEPPWSLPNILDCFTKHWMAVFSEILPKDAQQVLRELKFYFPKRRIFTLKTKDDLKCVVSVCTKFAKYFLMNDQYKTASSECCDALNQLLKNHSNSNASKQNISSEVCQDDIEVESDVQSNKYAENVVESLDERISQALVFIWNGFVTYCSQLANALGVPHDLDASISNNSFSEDLINQANSVTEQINLLIQALSRVLVSYPVDNFSPEYKRIEAECASDTMYDVVLSSVNGMGQSSLNFNKTDLISYCSIHRNILEDGFSKFMMLKKLLLECSNQYSKLQMGV